MRYIILIFLFGIIHGSESEALSYNEMMEEIRKLKESSYIRNKQQSLIFPGTFWCGAGHISPDSKTLGVLEKPDVCCRNHDNCSDTIPAGQTKHGLSNTSFYTKLHCTCDKIFYDCLKSNNDDSSNLVGKLYFNMLSTQCFNYDYPVIRCNGYGDIFGRRCTSYEFDKTKPKKYQWFDEPAY